MTNPANIHVLVIPSWYPPKGGEFFREHSLAVAAACKRTGVIACHYQSLRHTAPSKWLKSPAILWQDNGPLHEWHAPLLIIPFFMKANMRRWVHRCLQLYASYEKQMGRPDLIQAHSSMWAGFAAACIRSKYGIPYVLTEHRGRFLRQGEDRQPLLRSWHLPYLHEAFKSADQLVYVSQALRQGIEERFPGLEHKGRVIPNQVDTEFFRPVEDPDGDHRPGDKHHGADPQGENAFYDNPAGARPAGRAPFRLFALAHLQMEKGMDLLIRAFHQLHQNEPGAYALTIGGNGPERPRLQQMAQSLKLSDHIRFCGHLSREEVREQMQQAQLFVHPSRMESFGIVLTEAMSCGLPVVATRSGGPEEVVQEGSGLLCDKDDPTQLAGSIQSVKDNIRQYDPVQIRSNTISRYGIAAVSHQYLDIYQQLTEQ